MSNRKTIIALDLETTGLDPDRDSVIEIGLVRYHGAREEARWSTFVNPGCRIPPQITQLTGITDAMVANAPRFSQVLATVGEFIGEGALLGHNVAFDLSFFRSARFAKENDVIDTLELASALLPMAPRYALGPLCAHLGIPVMASHRALDDALASFALFSELMRIASSLPMEILADLVRFGQNVEWGGGRALESVYGERLRTEGALAKGPKVRFPSLEKRPDTGDAAPLEPRENPLPLNPEEVTAVIDAGGPFEKAFPGYEHRPPQMEMTAAVARAFSQSTHLMVEAGTGTGKSLAYLIPAVQWALLNGERVVISTNTINLQDQLIRKDFPDLVRVLGLDARAAVLKGKGNYICPRKLDILRHRGPDSPEEMRVLSKTLLWLTETTTGDRMELNLHGQGERAVWSRLSAQDEQCSPDACRRYGRGGCPFLRARKAAEEAHVLIVNHALLVADVAAENRVLPEYRYLIIDEGHQLEAAATDGLSFHCSDLELDRLIRELGSRRTGWLGTLAGLSRRRRKTSGPEEGWRAQAAALADALSVAQRDGHRLFDTLRDFIREQNENPASEYTLQYRIIPAVRTQTGWEDVEESWEPAPGPWRNGPPCGGHCRTTPGRRPGGRSRGGRSFDAVCGMGPEDGADRGIPASVCRQAEPADDPLGGNPPGSGLRRGDLCAVAHRPADRKAHLAHQTFGDPHLGHADRLRRVRLPPRTAERRRSRHACGRIPVRLRQRRAALPGGRHPRAGERPRVSARAVQRVDRFVPGDPGTDAGPVHVLCPDAADLAGDLRSAGT
jgi:DNA polymerase-3 subunit epsilon/ATP-dependent DNA helicase DinG